MNTFESMIKWNSKKTLVILLGFSALYIIISNIWWTYALIDYGKEQRKMSLQMCQSDSMHAAGDIAHTLIRNSTISPGPGLIPFSYNKQTMYVDTAAVKEQMNAKYTDFNYSFNPNSTLRNAYKIHIKPSVTYKYQRIYERKRGEWLGEGITSGIFMLIIIGVMYYYLDRILSLNQQQNNFLLATTHELRTPVAASKLAIETAKKSAQESIQPTLTMALNNMDRLSTLMDRVLLATRLETETGSTLHKEPIELKQLVEGTIKVISTSLPATVKFHTKFARNLTITADIELMQMALSNLITNAVKYSHLGEEVITIETHIQNNRVALSVADNGIGIHENQKKKIFEKFYRIGDEATRTSQGSGLGLYLVKKILRQHSAIISVHDVQPSGTLFNIVFKKAVVEP